MFGRGALLRKRAAVLGIRALHAGHERRIAAAALFGLGWTWLLMRGGLFLGLLLAYAIAIYPIQAYNCSSAPCISSSVPVVVLCRTSAPACVAVCLL